MSSRPRAPGGDLEAGLRGPNPFSTTHIHLLAALRAELKHRPRDATIRILDAGCGNGLLLSYLGHNLTGVNRATLELYGFDVADSGHVVRGFPESTVRHLARELPSVDWSDRISCTAVDQDWPYADATFDVVYSNQVLEHVFDLDHFLGQLARVLKPGGASVNVFPFKRVLWECHTSMPIVHRIRSGDARSAAVRFWSQLGIGRYRQYRGQGYDRDRYVEMSADLLQFACCHRTWTEIADAAKRAGLTASHRYTGQYYEQKARRLAKLPVRPLYSSRPSQLVEMTAFALLPFVASGTVVFERPVTYQPWEHD